MLRLKNSIGMVKECPQGFSWTTLFFGLFVPLLRGDLKNALIMGVVNTLTFGLSFLVYPFVYNKMYVKTLLMQGFTGATDKDMKKLINKGFIVEVKEKTIKEDEIKAIKVIEVEKYLDEVVEEIGIEEIKNDN